MHTYIKRRSYAKFKETIELPYLLQVQHDSWEWFLQQNVPQEERKNQGLQELFNEVFPITDFSERLILEFISYRIDKPKYTEEECKDKNLTYGASWWVKLRLIKKDTGELKEQEVYLREMPLMTKRATFIINGVERVVVNQLHRSAGIFYEYDRVNNIYSARILPYRGVWLEFELSSNNVIYVRLGKRRKLPATVILRIFGISKDEEILSCFHQIKLINLNDAEQVEKALGYRIAEDIIKKDIKIPKFTQFERDIVEKLKSLGIMEVKVVQADRKSAIVNTLLIDETTSENDALKKLFQVLRPGEPINLLAAKLIIQRLFFDPIRYNLGRVGRYKVNKKLGLNIKEDKILLTKEDLVAALNYLIKLSQKEGEVDDIDHLGNRRVRSVGELLQNHLRLGFLRAAKSIRERLSIQDPSIVTPQSVFNIKPIISAIQEFFGTNPLSQFMDQVNPLAELTHKRRLSALGHGGLSRERAGFEVRDVHPSHYGRICPVETPEGPNIGLITSLSTCTRINKYGFIETPYRKVKDGKIQDEIVYLTADEEEKFKIIPADIPHDEENNLLPDKIIARKGKEFLVLNKKEVNLIDVSLNQLTSVGTCLIPFLEHDDANRALMGTNMQRQAVPLLIPEVPLVGTGMEKKIVRDCGVDIVCEDNGIVKRATADEIIIKKTDAGEEKFYKLRKFKRSNQGTCINQKPLVKAGDRVEKGQVLTYGTATKDGELALGKNLLVAFVSWEGYNFEDAIVISERLVKEDIFTSVHIEEFEVEARETQLGPESITRDIPNIPDEFLSHLDEKGIVRIGCYVKAGDIIVGKVTPKVETNFSPEYKLLHSIFGEKVKEVRDTSVRIPHGSEGVVINVKYFSINNKDTLPTGVLEMVKVYIAIKRKITVGDKIAGRHGNKGVISKILPEEDMPYLEDGTPVDILLNPISVPSRMNLGQILETSLGWAAKVMDIKVESPVFNGATEEEVKKTLKEAGLPEDGRVWLYDGRTGERFKEKATVGYIYIMKLAHLVEDKIHARSIGPYSLITQQPLGGKAHFGGQRLGEMEVWALEAYGASNTLQELLTVKSDDITGRAKVYEAIVRGVSMPAARPPESFNVIVKELQALALDVKILDEKGRILDLDKLEERIERPRFGSSGLKGGRVRAIR
jgi:DNA-directed RNA polymerase subunit beta